MSETPIMEEQCSVCGESYMIGDWPFCPHGRAYAHHGFEPYLDEFIDSKPQWIATPGDRNKFLKPHWENDHIVHQQPRDKSNDYWKDLNGRREARLAAIKERR